MDVNYYPERDSLYIDLAGESSVKTREISEELILGYDGQGRLAAINILKASTIINLREITVNIPGQGQAW